MTFLTITGLSKVFRSRVKKSRYKALNNANLKINRGEILSLVGVNGAGKTTLSSIIATLITKTEGEILCEGKSVYHNLLAYRRKIGLSPQNPNLPSGLTLSEILLFSGRCYGLSEEEAKKRKEELFKEFYLEEFENAYVPQLSGGYRQRFLIARALVHKPELVILDEPTVGLDPHIRRELWDVIANLRKNGVSVLLTTHYLDEAERLSDRVCLMDKGMIHEVDTPSRLIKKYEKTTLEEVFLQFVDKEKKNE